MHMVPTIDLTAAQRATDTALATAASLDVRVVVCVCDVTGDPVLVTRMDGAPRFSVEVAGKKAWTAASTGAPTSALASMFLGDAELIHGLAPGVERLMPVSGGAPVLVDGQAAGAVGVSGATAEQDQQIADAAVAAITG